MNYISQTPGQFEAEMERRREAEDKRIAAAIKTQQQRDAAFKADQDQRQHEAGAARLEAHHEATRARILAAGGTAADFEKAWPELKQAYLIDAASSGQEERIYQQMRARGGTRW